jgi:16S rRNA (guanine966-N2)-methyltransferase
VRIIAGEFRSRRLKTVPGRTVRPTPDRLRETLFSVLAPCLEGIVFIDAYAGSGAVGMEALSRGAARAIFLERDQRAIEVIRENLSSLGITDRAEIVRGDAAGQLARHPGDIVFLDPPYEARQEYRAALRSLAGTRCELVIAQHASRLVLPDVFGPLRKRRIIRQGDNALSFFRREREPDASSGASE